ncbi:MAG TPA: isoprenylcysteine carboxylmethyltransferase family protein [Anaerolineales bacterium]|nr:isoprenylcysteine carboxylmethyltransferase family protein [Anaerolineales bacterium]
MTNKLLIRFAIREAMGLVFMGVALFWSAGSVDWWPARALIVLTMSWSIATAVVIARHRPDLLAERLGPRKGAKRWDTVLMSAHGLVQLAILVVSGLDRRFGWSEGIVPVAQVVAFLVCSVGYGLVVWATAANAFFSQIVRIQTERGHTVVSGGPYHYVRHPAYAGGILTQLSMPILLGSWWALLVGALDALLMVVRTALEDRTLKAELPGYPDYVGRVHHRLIPGIW